jgi:ATP-dependent helicase HrpB
MRPSPLPIDPLLPEIVEAVRTHGSLVLQAEPGAGKTTRVPWALLEAGLAGTGEILVLQPRRIAARMAARRIAEEHGERVGERVGYQVRFEDVSGPKTRLRLLTEGVLTRRLVSDPLLRGVGAVVLDEFHERHLQGDLALALLRRLQQTTRTDLKLVVMSATLDAAPVRAFLGEAPQVMAPGRRFPIAIEHLDKPDDRHLDVQVAAALKRLVREGLDGDVLVFLPGAAEIRRAQSAVEAVARDHDLEVVPLHGDLSPEEQDRAVQKGARHKVILSTNVAESSVTIPGVVAVIDSGQARIAGHSPWSGLPTLKTGKVSRASAIQRAGRAGRTGPGRCLRLYTEPDFHGRPEHEAAEVARLDLAETALALHGLGVKSLEQFAWYEAPPASALAATEALLQRLGAVDADGALTATGRELLRFPLHPRQARVLLEARARGAPEDGAILAALLGEGDLQASALFGGGGPRKARLSAPSDLLEQLALFREAERTGFDVGRLRGLGLDASATRGADRVRKQLVRIRSEGKVAPEPDPERALLLALLAGYPDRVARRRAGVANPELLLAGGGTAVLDPASVVQEAPFLVAVDAEERAPSKIPGASRSGARVRRASAIEPDWLLELFPDRVNPVTTLSWNASLERVEGMSQLLYDGLVLQEEKETQLDPEQAGALLAQKALEKGMAAFAPEDALAQLVQRTRFIAEAAPDAQVPVLDETQVIEALRELCRGRTRFSELHDASLIDVIRARLGGGMGALDALAPERLRLPNGRTVQIHYEPGKPPWAESFLQDFFGMAEGPKVARGRVPLVLHLLAPNRRAVQVSTDLAGFWARHYPAVRKELGRRYPRHSWPEDPRHATPPPPRPPRPPRR